MLLLEPRLAGDTQGNYRTILRRFRTQQPAYVETSYFRVFHSLAGNKDPNAYESPRKKAKGLKIDWR